MGKCFHMAHYYILTVISIKFQKTVLFFPVVIYTSLPQMEKHCCTGPGVQKLDKVIHWINLQPPDSANSFFDAAHPLQRDSQIYTVDSDRMYQPLNNWDLVLISDETKLPILVFLDAFERSEQHHDSFCLRHQIKDMACESIKKNSVIQTNTDILTTTSSKDSCFKHGRRKTLFTG